MADHDIAPSLEMEQDISALRQEWRFERAGWFIIAVLMVAAVAGLFGQGPVSRVTWQAPRSAATTVRYDRVARYGTTTTLSATIDATSPTDTAAVISIDRAYLGAVELQHVVPEPVESRASGHWVVFLFRRAVSGRPIQVDFTLAPTGVGLLHGEMDVGSSTLQLRQFVLP